MLSSLNWIRFRRGNKLLKYNASWGEFYSTSAWKWLFYLLISAYFARENTRTVRSYVPFQVNCVKLEINISILICCKPRSEVSRNWNQPGVTVSYVYYGNYVELNPSRAVWSILGRSSLLCSFSYEFPFLFRKFHFTVINTLRVC